MSVESFDQLGLSEPIMRAVREVGYETPSPIQAACIPVLMQGKDLLGQAQTGTGKTAAFALPLLDRIDGTQSHPQVLVLAPTRELAIQVAEAFQRYARHLPQIQVLPVYGGQAMGLQLKQLSRGAHVVIGTPGRILDHLERGTLKLDRLQAVVLDEADEMLRMGFIDDVETILSKAPKTRQTALFSATMPEPIRRIAHRHLNDPQEVRIKSATSTNAAIEQQYWMVSGLHKLDALTRILEVEDDLDAAIVFVRTKTATVELADRLRARGHAAAELNGDLTQVLRERIIEQLKGGQLDIVIATDVAARGLDVPRISHVINYDIPYDTESYVHRIGRTGRAGRAGKAILFVAPREVRMLRSIEHATRQPIKQMKLPTLSDLSDKRVGQFKTAIIDVLASEDLEFFNGIVSQLKQEQNVSPNEIAAALAFIAQRERPLQLSAAETAAASREASAGNREAPSGERIVMPAGGMLGRYRVAVGRNQGVQPKNLVGAIANEGGIDRAGIGRITLYDDYSVIELPAGLPAGVLTKIGRIRVLQHALEIRPFEGGEPPREHSPYARAFGGGEGGDSTPKRREPRADGAAPKRVWDKKPRKMGGE
jgi:ATP-dependent RNA helicase DeaD